MRLSTLCSVASACLIAAIPLACLPDPELNVRLDGVWLFRQDPEQLGISQGWYAPGADRERWMSLRLPSTWESLPGLEAHDGWGWYARMIVLADLIPPLSLHFAGVDDDAVVWINGIRVAEHAGYSEPFTVDATGYLRPGENVLVVLVNDHGGPGGLYAPVTLVESRHLEKVLRGPYARREARESAPWVRNAVIYSVYLRSFSPEGTFEGLRRRIPELKRMGVSVLWLLPIHPIGKTRRKGPLGSPYSIRDFYGINAELGTMDDFRALVRTVHAEGMHLILDLVANHTAWDSQLIEEHPEWFTRDETGAIVAPTADWYDVADLDYSQPALRRYMIEMMCWWVKEIGVDGFRCDVAELVPLDFWEEARRRLDAIRPVMMLSEGTLPEHHLAAFDLTYAWHTYDLLQPLLQGERPASSVHDALRAEEMKFPQGSLALRFTTNHDKNYWDAPAVEKFGRNGLRLGTVLMFTLPGVPLIFTGEEVANDRRLDHHDKVVVDWTRPRWMGDLYEKLALLRTRHPALRSGDYQSVPTDEEAVLAFTRTAGEDRVLVAINLSGQTRSVRLHAPHLAATVLHDPASGRSLRVAADGSLPLVLGPQAYALLPTGR